MRFPISLKVEKEDGAFYDFFVDLKDTRRLTKLILELLQAYHEAQERGESLSLDSVVKGVNLFDPTSEIEAHLDNIMQNHHQSIRHTSMLAQQVKQTLGVMGTNTQAEGQQINPLLLAQAGYGTQPTQVIPQDVVQPVSEEKINSVVDSRLTEVETKLGNFDNKLDRLIQLMTENQLQSAPQPVVQQAVVPSQPVVQPQYVAPEPQYVASTQQFVQPEPQYVVPTQQYTPQPAPVVQQEVSHPAPQGGFSLPSFDSTPQNEVSASDMSGAPTIVVQPTQPTPDPVYVAPSIKLDDTADTSYNNVSDGSPVFSASPIVGNSDTPDVPSEDVEPKKPASFNRAFGALKKKTN